MYAHWRRAYRRSLGVLRTKLWDEAAGRFVTFAEVGF
jgi:hypothetical protein